MPPAANPNPTRAKRPRPTVEYTNLEPVRVCDPADDSDASDEFIAVIPAKEPAAVVVRQEGEVPAMELAPARATGVNSLTIPLKP